MVRDQPTSGSTLSEEMVRYIRVNREKIDAVRYGTATIKIVDGHVHIWTWAPEERRGKEIDYLGGT